MWAVVGTDRNFNLSLVRNSDQSCQKPEHYDMIKADSLVLVLLILMRDILTSIAARVNVFANSK